MPNKTVAPPEERATQMSHRSFPAPITEQLSCGHHLSLCVEPNGLGTGAVCELCAAEAKVSELEAQLHTANDRFEAHAKHVSAFLSEMYAVMIDPLDSSDLKVVEMTATLLDAAKRDRETATMHADALGALRGQLEHADEIITQMETDLSTANVTIANKQETIVGLFAEIDTFQEIIIKNEPVWLGSGYSPAQCLRLVLLFRDQQATVAQQAATIERLEEQLWSTRQFVIDNVDSGKELDAVLEIDKTLNVETNELGPPGTGPLEIIAQQAATISELLARLANIPDHQGGDKKTWPDR